VFLHLKLSLLPFTLPPQPNLTSGFIALTVDRRDSMHDQGNGRIDGAEAQRAVS
jgi:hypothetical protein